MQGTAGSAVSIRYLVEGGQHYRVGADYTGFSWICCR